LCLKRLASLFHHGWSFGWLVELHIGSMLDAIRFVQEEIVKEQTPHESAQSRNSFTTIGLIPDGQKG
jgi:hypothetical protein